MLVNNQVDVFPITSSEFAGFTEQISDFPQNSSFAVAVSGGADSTALLLLTNDWVKERGGKLVALTVNHNLRPQAEDEAKQVKKLCEKIGVEHCILQWQHEEKPLSAVQERARDARYKLLSDYCKEHNIPYLLSAHHGDDQIETMFFRLYRGSGIDGLAAMSSRKEIHGITLLRPFLSIPKSRLIATLKERGQNWIEDPSNENIAYSRVFIRKKLAEIKNTDDFKSRALLVNQKFAEIRKIIERRLEEASEQTISFHTEGYAELDFEKFKKVEREIALKILGKVIKTIGGNDHPPRSRKLINLYDNLGTKHSLGRVLFTKESKGKIFVRRDKNTCRST